MKRFSVEAIFKAIDRVTQPVRKMESAVGRFTDSTRRGLKSFDGKLTRINQGFKKLATSALVAGAVIGSLGADTIKTGAQFEQSIVNAAAKYGDLAKKGSETYLALEDAARLAGRTTEFTASQSADAINELAKAGFNAQQTISALPKVIDLATAAEVDLAQATEISTSVLGAFNLKVEDAIQLGKNFSRVNDVLAATATSSKTTMESLFETFKQAGPPATAAGASLETVAALAGKLGDAGLQGELGGTNLKNMFTKLAAPAAGAQKILRRLGVSTRDSNGNLRDMIDIFEDLEKGLKGLGSADKVAALREIFDLRAIAGANILLGVGADKLREYRKQLENAQGASERMAGFMRNTLANNWKTFLSAVESVKISIFKTAEGPINDVVKRMTEWVRANEKLIASRIGEYLKFIFDNADEILYWSKVVGTAVAAVAGMSIATKIALGVMEVLTAFKALSVFFLTNPLGITIAALGSMVALVYKLSDATGSLSRAMDLVGGALLKALFLPLNLVILQIKLLTKSMAGLARAAGADDIAATFDKVTKSIQGMQDTMNTALTGSKTVIPGMDIIDALSKKGDVASVVKENVTLVMDDGSLVGHASSSQEEDVQLVGGPEMVSPAQSMAAQMKETKSTQSTEITIKDETGKAEFTGPQLPGLKLIPSGGFE